MAQPINLNEVQVTYSPSLKEPSIVSIVTLEEILNRIRGGEWAREIGDIRALVNANVDECIIRMEKAKLPGVCFNGLFSHRSAAGFVRSTGVVCVDIDCDSPDRADAIKDAIAHSPHLVAAFLSPTGHGVKAVCSVPPNVCHNLNYSAATADLLSHGVNEKEIDPVCGDVGRLCFVTHDPACIVHPAALLNPVEPASEAHSSDKREKKKHVKTGGTGSRNGSDHGNAELCRKLALLRVAGFEKLEAVVKVGSGPEAERAWDDLVADGIAKPNKLPVSEFLRKRIEEEGIDAVAANDRGLPDWAQKKRLFSRWAHCTRGFRDAGCPPPVIRTVLQGLLDADANSAALEPAAAKSIVLSLVPRDVAVALDRRLNEKGCAALLAMLRFFARMEGGVAEKWPMAGYDLDRLESKFGGGRGRNLASESVKRQTAVILRRSLGPRLAGRSFSLGQLCISDDASEESSPHRQAYCVPRVSSPCALNPRTLRRGLLALGIKSPGHRAGRSAKWCIDKEAAKAIRAQTRTTRRPRRKRALRKVRSLLPATPKLPQPTNQPPVVGDPAETEQAYPDSQRNKASAGGGDVTVFTGTVSPQSPAKAEDSASSDESASQHARRIVRDHQALWKLRAWSDERGPKLVIEHSGKTRPSGKLDIVWVHSIRPGAVEGRRSWEVRGFHLVSHGERESRYLNVRFYVNPITAMERLSDFAISVGMPDDNFRLEAGEIQTGIRRLDEVWVLAAKPGKFPWIDIVLRQPCGDHPNNVLKGVTGHAADQFERTTRRRLKDQHVRDMECLELAGLEAKTNLSEKDHKRRNYLRGKLYPKAKRRDAGPDLPGFAGSHR